MNKDNWVVVICSYLKFCTAEHKVKSSDLDEYNVLNNSFQALFGASKDFEVRVVREIVTAIREIVLSYELLNKKYYALLLGCLDTLVAVNLFRLPEIADNVRGFCLSMAESKAELTIKFVVDFLGHLSNQTIRELIADKREEKPRPGSPEVDFCLGMLDHMLAKNNPGINAEVLRIYEGLVDKHGYELPPELWEKTLGQIEGVLRGCEGGEVTPEVSRAGGFTSLQRHPKGRFQLHFLLQRAAFGVSAAPLEAIFGADRVQKLPIRPH